MRGSLGTLETSTPLKELSAVQLNALLRELGIQIWCEQKLQNTLRKLTAMETYPWLTKLADSETRIEALIKIEASLRGLVRTRMDRLGGRVSEVKGFLGH